MPGIQAIAFACIRAHAALASGRARASVLMGRLAGIDGAGHRRKVTAPAIVTAIPVVPSAILVKPFAILAAIAAAVAAGLGLWRISINPCRRRMCIRGPGAPCIKVSPGLFTVPFMRVRAPHIASARHGAAVSLAGLLAGTGSSRSGFWGRAWRHGAANHARLRPRFGRGIDGSIGLGCRGGLGGWKRFGGLGSRAGRVAPGRLAVRRSPGCRSYRQQR